MSCFSLLPHLILMTVPELASPPPLICKRGNYNTVPQWGRTHTQTVRHKAQCWLHFPPTLCNKITITGLCSSAAFTSSAAFAFSNSNLDLLLCHLAGHDDPSKSSYAFSLVLHANIKLYMIYFL